MIIKIKLFVAILKCQQACQQAQFGLQFNKAVWSLDKAQLMLGCTRMNTRECS